MPARRVPAAQVVARGPRCAEPGPPSAHLCWGFDAREPPRRAPPGAAGGAERAPARGGHARRGAAADTGRRGQRQDARARAPDRLPDLHRPGPGGGDPGDHVHQQGRQRDARAGGASARPRHARHVADDLPRGVRAHPARRGRATGLHAPVHDLRPGRRAPADQALGRRGGRRPQALHAGRHPQPDLGRQEPPDRRRRPIASRSARRSRRWSPTCTTSTSATCTA